MGRHPTATARPSCTPEDLEALRQRTGCAFAPMYWTWRVPWLRAQLRYRAHNTSGFRFVGLSEYIGLELLADPSMSVSMASATGLLSTSERSWDAEALELAGVEPAELPELAPPGWEGELAENWRERWPELASGPVAPGVGRWRRGQPGGRLRRPGSRRHDNRYFGRREVRDHR